MDIGDSGNSEHRSIQNDPDGLRLAAKHCFEGHAPSCSTQKTAFYLRLESLGQIQHQDVIHRMRTN
jgi:hypothetical protein